MITIYTHPEFFRHDTGIGHPENAARLNAALEGIRRSGLGSRVIPDPDAHPDTDRIIAKVHSPEYEREFDEACRTGEPLFHSIDNPISGRSFSAARTAVGAALRAAETMLHSGGRSFLIARPPGHHAERIEAMGFCFFNTIACAAEWLREQQGIERVFIFDFDVHHGNGTQHLFEDRDDVFYASMHRYPFFPGTGAADEVGFGRGRGYTHNIPLPSGTGDSEYLDAVEEDVVRLIGGFKPDAILVSAGFDAHWRDPLGGMHVSEQAFGEMTRRIAEAADRHAQGRVLSLLEGGYDMEGIAASVDEHVRALA